jgi:hypothetical protein
MALDPPEKSGFEQLRVGASRGRANLPQTPFFDSYLSHLSELATTRPCEMRAINE